jgi:hypothetical protein
MTDPYQALVSFQQALLLGSVDLRPGELDPKLFVHADRPNGAMRLTYVRLEGLSVTALVSVVHAEPLEGLPCFQIGYAVAELYRKQGRAIEAVEGALLELQHGLARAGISAFYVEAVIDTDNEASQRVARKTLSAAPDPVTDGPSGWAALHYLRIFETTPSS